MSTPPFVALPTGIDSVVIAGQGGELACLVAIPAHPLGAAVFVPGLTGSKEDFIALMPLLLARGWAVAALDLRGQYQSRCQPDTRFELRDFARDALTLITFMHERTGHAVQVLGHSFGGLVVRRAAIDLVSAQRSDQSSALGSLTLLASGPGALPSDLHSKLAPLIDLLPSMPLADIWTVKEAMDRADGWIPPSAEVAEFLRTRFIRNDPRAVRAIALLLTEATDDVDAAHQALAQAAVPVSVIYGEYDDAWAPAEQETMARRLGARRLLLPGVGHSPNSEAPELLAAELHGFWLGALRARTPQPDGGVATPPAKHPIDADWDRVPGSDHLVTGAAGIMLRIPASANSADISSVRRSIRPLLQQCGAPAQVGEVELVVAELLTNAARHGQAPLEARLLVTADAFRVEVYDAEGSSRPVHRRCEEPRSGGHGLSLISSVSRDWGVVAEGAGKIVWAEVVRHA